MIENIDRQFVDAVLFSANLHWEADPAEFLWLRAAHEGRWIRLKINPTFPDGPAYLLPLSDGGNVEFDDLPPSWTRGPLKWPESAKR